MEGAVPELPVEIGDVVADKYRIDRLIGRGGMGSVFQATHTQLLQKVALKFLSSSMLRRDDARTRFLREARAAAALTTEHVARVLDVGVLPSGVPFLVIEYLEGEDLAARLERGVFSVEEAVKMMMQACDALGEAHRLGIVHRDVKPHNLFLVRRPNGSVSLKVLDFGIAKVDDPNLNVEVITGTCAVMGTPQYMAPEQMTSTRNVDAAADVWALGVCLYECLTKRRPFESSNMLELGALVMNGAPASISAHRGDLPSSLVAVIDRCLAKDPARRYPDANALHEALASSQEKSAVVVTPPTMMTPHFATGTAPVPRGSAPPPAMPSPRLSSPPQAPLLTATSFGDPSAERQAVSAEPARSSSRASSMIVVGLLGLVLVVAIGVKVARRTGDGSPATAADPTVAAVPSPAPSPSPSPVPSPVAEPTTQATQPSVPLVTAGSTSSSPAASGARHTRHPGGTNVKKTGTTPPSTNTSVAPTPTAAPAER